MGYDYKVWVWKEVNGKWDYVQVYSGDSHEAAFAAMRQEKRNGCGCVKLEWRGEYKGEW